MSYILVFTLTLGLLGLVLLLAVSWAHERFRKAELGRQAENRHLRAQKRLTRDLVLQMAREVGSPARQLLEKGQLHPGTADQAWQVLTSAQEAMEWVESDDSNKHFLLEPVNLFAIIQTLVAFHPAEVALEFLDYGTAPPLINGAIVKVRKSLIKLVEYAAQLEPIRGGRVTLMTTPTHARVLLDLGVATEGKPQTFALATARNWIEAMGGELEMGAAGQPSFTVTFNLLDPEPDPARNPVTAPQRVVA